MTRVILGCLAGVFIALGLVVIFEGLSHLISPMPEGLDLDNREAMAAYVAQVPIAAKFALASGWAIAGFAGSALAAWISKRGWTSWVVGGLMFAGLGSSLIAIPHPIWMIFAAIAGVLFATIIGSKFAEFGADAPDR